MNQSEKRLFLIQSLLNERPSCRKQEIPTDSERQGILLRGLMNVRRPASIGREFLQVQDDYLKEETEKKGITNVNDIVPIQPGLYLWQDDITTLRCDDTFVEDEGWHQAAERYENFLRARSGQRILFLELGVGYNTPAIIKYPFRCMTAKNPNAIYACINRRQAVRPGEIEKRAICIDGDIGDALRMCGGADAP